MLTIHIDGRPERDVWDANKEEFVIHREIKPFDLMLEHSLVSVSKWESKWHVPFISKDGHTEEQTLDYIKCMTINHHVPDEAYDLLSAEDVQKISNYISDPMTATTVSELPGQKKGGKEIITSELIYYWMTALQIPFECDKWHLNRLLQLVAVCNAKNTPPKKMGKNEIMSRNKALNEARKAKYHTKG